MNRWPKGNCKLMNSRSPYFISYLITFHTFFVKKKKILNLLSIAFNALRNYFLIDFTFTFHAFFVQVQKREQLKNIRSSRYDRSRVHRIAPCHLPSKRDSKETNCGTIVALSFLRIQIFYSHHFFRETIHLRFIRIYIWQASTRYNVHAHYTMA